MVPMTITAPPAKGATLLRQMHRVKRADSKLMYIAPPEQELTASCAAVTLPLHASLLSNIQRSKVGTVRCALAVPLEA